MKILIILILSFSLNGLTSEKLFKVSVFGCSQEYYNLVDEMIKNHVRDNYAHLCFDTLHSYRELSRDALELEHLWGVNICRLEVTVRYDCKYGW